MTSTSGRKTLSLLLAFTLLALCASPRSSSAADKPDKSTNKKATTDTHTTTTAARAAHDSDAAGDAHAARDLSRLPLQFEANRGQTDPSVRFVARGAGYALFLTPRGALVSPRGTRAGQSSLVRLNHVGANQRVSLNGQNELPGKVNYLTGRDPRAWRRDVPTYGAVLYAGLYRGVDLLYYGAQGRLEYDYRLAPHADPRAIRFSVEGARRVTLDADGDLIIETGAGGRLVQHKPVAFQQAGGERREVACSYRINEDKQVSFALGAYDPARELTIDPVVTYSTLAGGSSYDTATGVGVGTDGAAYVTGYTESLNFPGTGGGYQPSLRGGTGQDAFVFKLNATGDALVYATYLGGAGFDRATKVKVDAAGAAYVAGQTYSADFPVTPGAPGVVQQSAQGGGDAFLAQLSADGRALLYSTFLGGSQDDYAADLALDPQGGVHLTGFTYSADFPVTPSALQPSNASAPSGADAFVARVEPAGAGLTYSTYLGGEAYDSANALALDSLGNVVVVGTTNSLNFPTTPDAVSQANAGMGDAFVVKVAPGGSALAYATYLGGAADDGANGVAVDAANNFYVTGGASSASFPTTPNSYQPLPAGGSDAFLLKWGADNRVVYGTMLGRGGNEAGQSVGVDSSGAVYVAGQTSSADFPATANAYQRTFGGYQDAFVARLDAAGGALLYATFLGADLAEVAYSLALDSSSNLYVAGYTRSASFPTSAAAFQRASNGLNDAFVVRFSSDLGYRLGGRVTDQSGAGMGGVTVNLSGAQSGSAQTDASGNYAFDALPSDGSYTLTPARPGYAFTPQSFAVARLSANTVANFTGAQQSYTVSGRVTDTCGNPVASVVMSLAGGQTQTTQTDSSGNYAFAGVPGGASYTVTPNVPNYMFTPGSIQLTNLSASQPGQNFTGRMMTAGPFNAAADAYVQDGSTSGSNFGTSTQLLVRLSTRSSANDWTYLRFDLPNNLCNVSRVSVQLYGRLSDSKVASITSNVYGVPSSAWTETGITWTNKPADAGTILSTRTVSGTAGAWYDFDITSYVQSELAAGRRQISLVLKNQLGAGGTSALPTLTVFDSREAANKPRLSVTLP